MADEEDGAKSKDKGDEEESSEVKPKKKRPWLLIGIIGFFVVILLSGSVVGGLYYMGMFDDKDKKTVAVKLDENGDVIEGEDEDAEDEDEEDDEEEDGEEGDEDKKQQAIYVPIESTFVVNFEGVSKVKFLQVTVELMTREEAVVESITTHMPLLRNNLTFLFSSRSYEDVSTIEGKEQLRAAALSEVQKIMEEETGNPSVEALYFTSFVTQ